MAKGQFWPFYKSNTFWHVLTLCTLLTIQDLEKLWDLKIFWYLKNTRRLQKCFAISINIYRPKYLKRSPDIAHIVDNFDTVDAIKHWWCYDQYGRTDQRSRMSLSLLSSLSFSSSSSSSSYSSSSSLSSLLSLSSSSLSLSLPLPCFLENLTRTLTHKIGVRSC